MLVLAGVAINLAVDSNGLFAKANQAAVAQDRGVILEKLNLELLWSNTAEESVEFLQLLENNNWADSDAVLNIQNLIGKKLTTGNGSNKDVYRVEIEDNKYKLIYYDNEQTRIEIGIIGEKQEYVPTYTQADIDELLRYFNFDETTGKLTANVDVVGSNYEYQTLPAKLVIPKEINGVKVTDIGHPGFYDMYSLMGSDVEEVIILAEISIKPFMFYASTNLKRVAIGEGVTSIERGAFDRCSSLREVIIADSVTSIEYRAFSDCTSLSSITIPNSVTSIGDEAFSGCTSLSEITIPSSVTSIGERVFSSCTNLVKIEVDENNNNYKSIEGMLYNKLGTKLLRSANKEIVAIEESVTDIEQYAFSGCTLVKEIIIPRGVTEIRRNTFSGCTSLEKVTIPSSVTGIRGSAFSNCTSLSEIIIPSSVTYMEYYIFDGCTSLTKIYCEAAEQPSGWFSGTWNDGCSAEVEWGYTQSSET